MAEGEPVPISPEDLAKLKAADRSKGGIPEGQRSKASSPDAVVNIKPRVWGASKLANLRYKRLKAPKGWLPYSKRYLEIDVALDILVNLYDLELDRQNFEQLDDFKKIRLVANTIQKKFNPELDYLVEEFLKRLEAFNQNNPENTEIRVPTTDFKKFGEDIFFAIYKIDKSVQANLVEFEIMVGEAEVKTKPQKVTFLHKSRSQRKQGRTR